MTEGGQKWMVRVDGWMMVGEMDDSRIIKEGVVELDDKWMTKMDVGY